MLYSSMRAVVKSKYSKRKGHKEKLKSELKMHTHVSGSVVTQKIQMYFASILVYLAPLHSCMYHKQRKYRWAMCVCCLLSRPTQQSKYIAHFNEINSAAGDTSILSQLFFQLSSCAG